MNNGCIDQCVTKFSTIASYSGFKKINKSSAKALKGDFILLQNHWKIKVLLLEFSVNAAYFLLKALKNSSSVWKSFKQIIKSSAKAQKGE